MSTTRSARRSRLRPLAASLLPLLLAACGGSGGGGGSSPTAPIPPMPAPGAATVQGRVVLQGGGSSTAAPGRVAAAASAADVRVSVEGTGIATTADAGGNYTLGGVPSGNQTVVFESGSMRGGVGVSGIQEQEVIQLSVTLGQGGVTVTSMQRGEGGIDPTQLSLQVSPSGWNLNYDHSNGWVEAFVRGPGIDQIDLHSLELTGDDSKARPLPAASATREGDHVRGRFAKNRVLDLLLDPQPGSRHEVTLHFADMEKGDPFELTAMITIEGDSDGGGGGGGGGDGGGDDGGGLGNLTLQISPNNWNTNYRGSSGQVQALIRGDGLDEIDLDSISMSGDNPLAAPLPADSAALNGNHVAARFPKNRVLDLLTSPGNGSLHTVTVEFLDGDGGSHELTATVKVNGRP